MIQSILAYVQVFHVGIILFLTLQLYKYPNNLLDVYFCIAEIALTLIDVLMIQKSFNMIPVLISCTLFSSYLPPDMRWVVVLFLAKILYANEILSDAKKLLLSGDNCSLCQLGGIVYNFVRFTIVEYMFLGIVIMAYKFVVLYLDKSMQELPQNYVLFYQMMVTATTIGYGDVCPKSRIQMNFFIGAIPFICGSFVIYGNNVNPLWEQFLTFWNKQSHTASQNIIEVSSMTLSQKGNLNEFARLSAEHRRQSQNLRQTYYGDWISMAAINYEKQSDLINNIIDDSFSKQIKLSISSKVRQQYFPKNWVILEANDSNSQLFMLVDGEIDFNGETKTAGFVFNQQGFFCQAISGNRIVTKTFASVWAISLSDLQELGSKCPGVKDKINANITAYS